MKTLEVLFVDQLADMHDAEQRIAAALPKLIKAATCPKLQNILERHLTETREHAVTLDHIFKSLSEENGSKTCHSTIGILKETEEIIADFKGSPAINAALILAAQKIEHYEIASYGCLREWAELLNYDEPAELLGEILEQEKNSDEALTDLARSTQKEEACASAPVTNGRSHRNIEAEENHE